MEVKVQMWGNLRWFLPSGVAMAAVQVPESATIEDLANQFKIEQDEWAVAVNGRLVSFSTVLSSGDRVFLFDHMHGS